MFLNAKVSEYSYKQTRDTIYLLILVKIVWPQKVYFVICFTRYTQ